jgi:hypothetical protein
MKAMDEGALNFVCFAGENLSFFGTDEFRGHFIVFSLKLQKDDGTDHQSRSHDL